MNGLFVKRHAIAVAGKCDVCVLFLQPAVEQNRANYSVTITKENNLTEIIIYYKNFQPKIVLLSSLVKLWRLVTAYRKGFIFVKKEFGNIDLIHVNILTRTGVVALYKKLFSGIPYIVTEHWSRYLPRTNTYKGGFRKWFTRIVIKKASAVTTISDDLKNAMINHHLINGNYKIVPNVVDTGLFTFNPKPVKSIKSILHVSCFEDRSKNISGILRVIKALSEKRQDFVCRLVGDGIDKSMLENNAKELGIFNNFAVFEGLKENKELADIYSASDFLLMFSNYENIPVVIDEAFACGIPVVSSDVGGISEVVTEDKGILVNPNDEAALEKSMNYMLDNLNQFDACSLRQYALKHLSNDVVGDAFFKIYKDVFVKK